MNIKEKIKGHGKVMEWSSVTGAGSPLCASFGSNGAAGKQETNMTDVTQAVDNGVNVEALLGARAALTEAPEAARFVWRTTSEWKNGTHTQSSVEKFFGLGEEQRHLREYRYDTDHPEIFASEDNGSTPVEFVLVGLAGCLTAGIAAVATNRGIQLNSVTATLDADMDIQGILGIDSDVRNGFNNITVKYKIDADASAEDIAAIVAQSQKRSAVFDIITNPTNVNVEVNK
jgi:uncharacterized OsmC-like protein